MAEKKVKVTFDPDAGSDWSFKPMQVNMNKKGKIRFVRAAASGDWTFVSFNPLPPTWSQSLEQEETELVVTDSLIPPTGTFRYTITVFFEGAYYTSPKKFINMDGPPIIMNEV